MSAHAPIMNRRRLAYKTAEAAAARIEPDPERRAVFPCYDPDCRPAAILLMAFFVALRPFVLVFWRFCGWMDGLGAGAGDQAFAGGGRPVMTVFMRTAHDAKTW